MFALITRFVLVVALVGVGLHPSMAIPAGDAIARSPHKSGLGDCPMGTEKPAAPGACVAACALAPADLPEVVALLHPQNRVSWALDDASADGAGPSPDPTPPRA